MMPPARTRAAITKLESCLESGCAALMTVGAMRESSLELAGALRGAELNLALAVASIRETIGELRVRAGQQASPISCGFVLPTFGPRGGPGHARPRRTA